MLKYSKTTHTKERMAVDAGWRKKEKRKSKEKAGKGIIGAIELAQLGNNRKNALITLSNDT